ncbi:MAG: VanW family protein [Clostridia bacterium]|nr:VanW family protein [Clostridia bacterium]
MSDEKKTVGKRQAATSAKRKRKNAAAILGVVLVVLTILGALGFCGYTAYHVLMSTDIFPGVRMGDCDLSGMDRSQARTALEAAYGGSGIDAAIDIQAGDQQFTLTARECGLEYDIPASIDQAYAYGRQGGFLYRARQYWTTRNAPQQMELVTVLDRNVLQTRVDEIAAAIEQPMAPSAWSYADGVITLDKGQVGYSLDKEALCAALDNKLRTADFTAMEAVRKEAHPQALSAAVIAAAVNCDVVQTTLDMEADPTGNTVREGTLGVSVSDSDLNAAIASANRHETVQCTLTAPDYTAAEYKALLFRDVLGQCTTDFNPGNVGRTTNVLLATDFCNGVILMPGEIFSYNESVGPRTYERGFKDATVYVGNSAEDGVGGGICQVSSTIYYAALRADLKIVERYAHSRMVTYVPLGEDATVAWGSKDFRFENNTPFPMKVVTSHKKDNLTVKLYGTQTENKTVKIVTNQLSKTPFEVVYEIDETLAPGTESVKSNGYTGYQTESYRVVYIDGVEVSRTFENKSTYKKYDKVILHNPKPETPTAPTTPVVNPTVAPTQPAPTEPAPTEPATEPTTVPAGGFLTNG